MPIGIDTVSTRLGYGPLVGTNRTSGAHGDILLGSAILDMIYRGPMGVGGVISGAIDPNRQVSSQDLSNARTMIPFERSMGLKQILDAIQTRLPKESTR